MLPVSRCLRRDSAARLLRGRQVWPPSIGTFTASHCRANNTEKPDRPRTPIDSFMKAQTTKAKKTLAMVDRLSRADERELGRQDRLLQRAKQTKNDAAVRRCEHAIKRIWLDLEIKARAQRILNRGMKVDQTHLVTSDIAGLMTGELKMFGHIVFARPDCVDALDRIFGLGRFVTRLAGAIVLLVPVMILNAPLEIYQRVKENIRR